MSIRLNKLLASRGVGSRRHCDGLIAEGRVSVNGRVVNEAGTTVEEERDRIEVDGKPVAGRQRTVYFVLNKPVGVITTMADPQGRRTVRELMPRGARVYPVGRLDADTSGLLLLTNDGELAHKLMHPRYGVTKTYRVRLDREPTPGQLSRLERGVEFEPGVVSAPASARRIDPGFDAIMIEVQVHEGRFRQVRRMCEAVGLRVTGLHRVGYGPLRLGPMTRGMFRELSEKEVEQLRASAARPMRGGRPRPGAPARRVAGAPPAVVRPGAARPARGARPPADEDEFEETWVPGGGFTREIDSDDNAPAWPRRADGRRGDADYVPPAGTPRPGRRAQDRARAERAGSGTRPSAPRAIAREERPRPDARFGSPRPETRTESARAGARGGRPRPEARAAGPRAGARPAPESRRPAARPGPTDARAERGKRRGRGPRPAGPKPVRGARFSMLSARGPGSSLRDYRGRRPAAGGDRPQAEGARPRGERSGTPRARAERGAAPRGVVRRPGPTQQTFGRESARPAPVARGRAAADARRERGAPPPRGRGGATAPRRAEAGGGRPGRAESRAPSARGDRGFSPARGRATGGGGQSPSRGGRQAARPGAGPRGNTRRPKR